MRAKSSALCLVLALAASLAAPAQSSSPWPRLGSLGSEDMVYKQQQEQLAAAYTALAAGKSLPDLVIYSYTIPANAQTRGGIDLFSLSARLNLPYESIATLNHLDRAREFLAGERLLVPSIPGLFTIPSGRSDLDWLLSYRDPKTAQSIREIGSGRQLLFFAGARFSSEERALFLGLLFRFPLPYAVLSSGFGLRDSPITGKISFHPGIDLAAPSGTDVYAAREGIVTESAVNDILGEYIVLSHEGGWSTVYGHLSQRLARLNDRVESGMIIGKAGSTGLSTGPHLHFEVRNRGEPRDPASLIPRGKQ